MILFALAATLIYLLSHSLILVAVHQPRNNDFPLQRALQDQFMNGHTTMRLVQKTESDQVGFDVTLPVDSNDLEEQYEAKIAEQGNEEVEDKSFENERVFLVFLKSMIFPVHCLVAYNFVYFCKYSDQYSL